MLVFAKMHLEGTGTYTHTVRKRDVVVGVTLVCKKFWRNGKQNNVTGNLYIFMTPPDDTIISCSAQFPSHLRRCLDDLHAGRIKN